MKALLRIAALALAACGFATPAAAQIRVINPFAAPQGSVQQLVTANSATGDPACTAPATNLTGFVPRTGNSWNGHKWGMNNALSWNHNVPDALCWGIDSDFLKFVLHDTVYDRGQNDPSTKRRDEIGSADTFKNGVHYWFAYSFILDVQNLNKNFGEAGLQIHWPSGASPAIGIRYAYLNGGVGFRVTTKDDASGNVNRGAAVPLTLGVPHDVVMEFQLGGPGAFEKVWLDGRLVSSYVGQVGSTIENGYSMRVGLYGAPFLGMTGTYRVKHMAVFPSTTVLSARVAAPPAW
jgi:hypothetical protein